MICFDLMETIGEIVIEIRLKEKNKKYYSQSVLVELLKSKCIVCKKNRTDFCCDNCALDICADCSGTHHNDWGHICDFCEDNKPTDAGVICECCKRDITDEIDEDLLDTWDTFGGFNHTVCHPCLRDVW